MNGRLPASRTPRRVNPGIVHNSTTVLTIINIHIWTINISSSQAAVFMADSQQWPWRVGLIETENRNENKRLLNVLSVKGSAEDMMTLSSGLFQYLLHLSGNCIISITQKSSTRCLGETGFPNSYETQLLCVDKILTLNMKRHHFSTILSLIFLD
ncbi:hypothetical protein J6590_026998 [Homalodisca vitripennis]|nr:hypothetical protein J6590_026998 [Homalodisca vitripennis]